MSKLIEKDIAKIFASEGMFNGRMISSSKSHYRMMHPNNIIYFNANIFTEYKKIWYGDLDISVDRPTLRRIVNALQEDIYILSEMDGRFENEQLSLAEIKNKCKFHIQYNKHNN